MSKLAQNPDTSSLTDAIPVSLSSLKQLDRDGVEYIIVMQNESLSDYVWINIIPTAKSFLGLFHAGIHIGKTQTTAA